MKTFTIAALFYGPYPKLADRLLHSMLDNLRKRVPQLVDIRLGLNDISAITLTSIRVFTDLMCKAGHTVYWYVPRLAKHELAYKYPTMRRMLYGIVPVEADYFMWFDDDSVMCKQVDWLGHLEQNIQGKTIASVRYKVNMVPAQKMWIMGQTWSPPVAPPLEVSFPAGSWWMAKTGFLEQWNYPFPELRHCGGDSMFGQLIYAQCPVAEQMWFPHQNGFVHHNCNETLRPSSATRRGFTERLLAEDFVGYPLPTSHHDIDFDIIRYREGSICHATDFGKRKHAEDTADLGNHAQRGAYQEPEPEEQRRLLATPGED